MGLLRRNRVLLALVAVELSWGFGMVAFEQLTPVRLLEIVGDPDAAAAVVGPASSAAWLASAAGAALVPLLGSRLGLARWAALTRLLQAVTVVGIGLFGGVVGVVTAYLACYVVHGAANPAHMTLLHRQVDGSRRATVVSLNSMAAQPAGALGAVALTALADAASVSAAVYVGAACSPWRRRCTCPPGGRSARSGRGRAAAGAPAAGGRGRGRRRGPTAPTARPGARGARCLRATSSCGWRAGSTPRSPGRCSPAGELRWADLGAVDLAGVGVVGNATHGKHLLTRLDDGRTLHTHLRMEGVWRLVRTGDLASGAQPGGPQPVRPRGAGHRPVDLPGHQPRDGGPRADGGGGPGCVGHLGPDLLAPDLDVDAAAARILAQGGRGIGEVLLDQTVVAGLGTIYMAESLWTHRVWPWAPARLAGRRRPRPRDHRTPLMLRSADARLPTATGDPRRTTNVHGRERRPCPRCGTPVARGEVGQRRRRRARCTTARRASARRDGAGVTGPGHGARPGPCGPGLAGSVGGGARQSVSRPGVSRLSRRTSSSGTVSGTWTPSSTATRSETARSTKLMGTLSASQMEASSSDEASF